MSVAEISKRQAHVASGGIALGSLLTRALVHFAKRREQRRAIRQLSNYPDALLKDVGLARSDIDWCVRHGRPDAKEFRRD